MIQLIHDTGNNKKQPYVTRANTLTNVDLRRNCFEKGVDNNRKLGSVTVCKRRGERRREQCVQHSFGTRECADTIKINNNVDEIFFCLPIIMRSYAPSIRKFYFKLNECTKQNLIIE